MCRQNTPESIEGKPIADFLRHAGKRIIWPPCANTKMYAHMARHQPDGDTIKVLFLDELLVDMNCAFPGDFAHVVRPKITSSLQFKFDKLVKTGVLIDNPAFGPRGKAVTWPEWTTRWAQPGWDGDIEQPPPPPAVAETRPWQPETGQGPGPVPGANLPHQAHFGAPIYAFPAMAPNNTFDQPLIAKKVSMWTGLDDDCAYNDKNNKDRADGDGPIDKSSSGIVVSQWLDRLPDKDNNTSNNNGSSTSQATTLVGQSIQSPSPSSSSSQARPRPHPPQPEYSLATSRHAHAHAHAPCPRVNGNHLQGSVPTNYYNKTATLPTASPSPSPSPSPLSMLAQSRHAPALHGIATPPVIMTIRTPSLGPGMKAVKSDNDNKIMLPPRQFSAVIPVRVKTTPITGRISKSLHHPAAAAAAVTNTTHGGSSLDCIQPMIKAVAVVASEKGPATVPLVEQKPFPQQDTFSSQSIPLEFPLDDDDGPRQCHINMGQDPSCSPPMPPPQLPCPLQSLTSKTPPSPQRVGVLLPLPTTFNAHDLTIQFIALLTAVNKLAHHLRRIRDTNKDKRAAIMHQVANLLLLGAAEGEFGLSNGDKHRVLQQHQQQQKLAHNNSDADMEIITLVAEHLGRHMLEIRAQHCARRGVNTRDAGLSSLCVTVKLLLGVHLDIVDEEVGVHNNTPGEETGKSRGEKESTEQIVVAVRSSGLRSQFLSL